MNIDQMTLTSASASIMIRRIKKQLRVLVVELSSLESRHVETRQKTLDVYIRLGRMETLFDFRGPVQ